MRLGWPYKRPIKYTEPERYTPDVARERRLAALLERERRFAEVPNFPEVQARLQQKAALSRVYNINEKMPEANQVRRRYGPKEASIASALKRFSERDFADPLKREQYRALRKAQEASRQNVPPSGGNKSYFNPTGKEYGATIYGTAAKLTSRLVPNMRAGWKPGFAYPLHALPCIQRTERREVMFAKGKAGSGYHTKKRRTWTSSVPC